MKSTSLLVAAASCLSIVSFAHAADNAVLLPPGEIKWVDVPNAKGVQIAPVQGDPSKGPSHFFLKFAPGFSAPCTITARIISGRLSAATVALTVDGQERKLPAGSYFAFTGKKPHATRCETGADCVLSIDARGKWDVVQQKKKK
jgi:hypothetical protein